jgi:ribosomal protein L37AE/L43A
MYRPPDRCPDPDCENSLGGSYQKSQFRKVEDGVWECRQCGYVREV